MAAGSRRTLHVRLKSGGEGEHAVSPSNIRKRCGGLPVSFPFGHFHDCISINLVTSPSGSSEALSLSPSLLCPEEGSLGLRAHGACEQPQSGVGQPGNSLEGGDLKEGPGMGGVCEFEPRT